MEEFVPAPGGANGTSADTAMTREEQEEKARWWITHYEILCRKDHPEDMPDTSALHRPPALKIFQWIRKDVPHIYEGVLRHLVIKLGDFWPTLDAEVQHFVDPGEMPVTLPYVPDALMPPLPGAVRYDPALAQDAGAWLDGYCAFSREASPRGAASFHSAVGLWVLSTLAARRICVEAGKRTYPMLFLAFVARSTLYAKTTTAVLGLNILEEALGVPYLLAPDESTPQALQREMAGAVPQDYGLQTAEAQDLTRKRVAFAAQKGWLYDEWGGMLKQMTRSDSTMSGFHKLLRQLDDGRRVFTSNTVVRGTETARAPYLALLAMATPHDLQRFMEPGSAFWHDGFWPRFAFVFPRLDEAPNLQETLWQLARLPHDLLIRVHEWHRWLGMPEIDVVEAVDKKGQATGGWRVAPRVALPCHVLPVAPEVRAAYQAYNVALLTMIAQGEVTNDLESWYGRLHDKCLRIAMLLCSLSETTATVATPTITMRYWVYAQQMTESWRAQMHEGLQIIAQSQPLSREEQLEQNIETMVRKGGPRTARECQQYLHHSSTEVRHALAAMVAIGRLREYPTQKTVRYGLPVATHDATADHAAEEQSHVPF